MSVSVKPPAPSSITEDDTNAVLAIAAHELKNAMGGLGVVLARCEQRLANGQVITQEHVAAARAELRRLSALVNDLLDGARVDLGMAQHVPRAADLVALILEVVDTFRAAHGRPVRLDLPAPPLIIEADPERVRAVVVNFLENAAKYAEAPSEITLRVASSPDRPADVRIAVTDQGPGIHPDDRARLFQRFFRAPGVAKRTRGLGLGLYVCRSVAEAHGGQVGVDSVHGAGATFWIDLPTARPMEREPDRRDIIPPADDPAGRP